MFPSDYFLLGGTSYTVVVTRSSGGTPEDSFGVTVIEDPNVNPWDVVKGTVDADTAYLNRNEAIALAHALLALTEL